MAKSKEKIVDNATSYYDRLIDMHPTLKRKGKTMPYTSVNGHMFSFLDKDGVMGLRLPPEERDAFIRKYKTRIMEQYGRVMAEYVVVPEKLLSDTLTLLKYLEKSYEYVSALKPKKTTRSKKE